MKRIISLLVVFAMVIAMVPSVFAAAKDQVDFDELVGKLVYLDSIDTIIVSMAEGAGSKTYKWTPENDGVLTLFVGMPEDAEVEITLIQGENSVKYDADEAFEMELVGGTEVSIVVTKTSEAALEEVWGGMFNDPYGTEFNPIFLTELKTEVTTKFENTWFAGRFNGATMKVTGTGEFSVTANGTPVAAVDGVVTMPVSAPFPMMPFQFTLDKIGAYTIAFEFPAGHEMNPAELLIGTNETNVTDTESGYFYNWTAEKAGDLTITMPEGNWFYVVNNKTAGTYGDGQWSDNDPVVPSTTVTVKAGDVIEVKVNTYDPTNPYAPPAPGTITFTAAFEEVKYTVGDLDGNEVVDIDDAIWLLLHTMLGGENYPLNQPVDYDKNNTIDIDDAIWLLLHTMLGADNYPLV